MFFTQRRKGNLRSKVVTTHFFAPLPLGVKPTFISENPISLKNAKRKNQETKFCFFAPLHLGVKPFSISQNSTHPVMDFYPLLRFHFYDTQLNRAAHYWLTIHYHQSHYHDQLLYRRLR